MAARSWMKGHSDPREHEPKRSFSYLQKMCLAASGEGLLPRFDFPLPSESLPLPLALPPLGALPPAGEGDRGGTAGACSLSAARLAAACSSHFALSFLYSARSASFRGFRCSRLLGQGSWQMP